MKTQYGVLLALLIASVSEPLAAKTEDKNIHSSGENSPPQKTIWKARLLPGQDLSQITSLEFSSQEFGVFLVPRDGKLRPLAEVQGTFNREGWNLFVQTPGGPRPVKFNDKKFSVYAFLTGHMSQVDFLAVGPHEENEKHQIMLFAPEAQEFKFGSAWGELFIDIGPSMFKYFQTGTGDFSSKTVTLGAEYAYQQKLSRWGFMASLRSPLWTMVSSPVEADPSLFQSRLLADFKLKIANPDFPKIKLSAGLHYLTLIRSGAPFGFSNLIAPEVGVDCAYVHNPNLSYFLRMTYVPLGGMSFSESGIDLGVGLLYQFKSLKQIRSQLTFSRYAYKPQENAEIRTSLISLLVGFGF